MLGEDQCISHTQKLKKSLTQINEVRNLLEKLNRVTQTIRGPGARLHKKRGYKQED